MVDGPKDCHVERLEREKQVSYINTYMWNLEKNGTDEPICKAEIETQTWITNIWTPSGERESGMNWEVRIDIHTLLLLLLSRFSRVRLCATP